MNEKNLIRFSVTFYAFCDSLQVLKHGFSGVMKMKFNTVLNIMEWLLKEVQKKMTDYDKEVFERGSELVHSIVDEALKCPNPEIALEMLKQLNAGQVKIEKE
jgi:hypothetical protein